MSQQESVASFAQKLNEVCIMSRADMSQFGMRGLDVRIDGSVHQLSQRRFVVGEVLKAAAHTLVVRAGQPRSRQGAATQDVRQHHRALHVLHQHRDQCAQLLAAQRVGQVARPVDVVDGQVGVLVVGQVEVLHG